MKDAVASKVTNKVHAFMQVLQWLGISYDTYMEQVVKYRNTALVKQVDRIIKEAFKTAVPKVIKEKPVLIIDKGIER
jgi:dihydropteroate synthase